MSDSDSDTLARYRADYGAIQGYFTPEAQTVWEFLLSMQRELQISGNFLEIGVWKGKSAVLGAMHLRDQEVALLVDLLDIHDALQQVRSASGCRVETVKGPSSLLRFSPLFSQYAGTIRWFHVDGDHAGFSCSNDLGIAADMLGASGIICVDDFFNIRYPQLAAAVFAFLTRDPRYRMFLCGANKAFLCRAEDYPMYESLIRERLATYMKEHGHSVTIAKTSYAHDQGCFAIEPRFRDRDVIGLDSDPDRIVF